MAHVDEQIIVAPDWFPSGPGFLEPPGVDEISPSLLDQIEGVPDLAWRTRDYHIIAVHKMADSHLNNAIRYIIRTRTDGVYWPVFNTRGRLTGKALGSWWIEVFRGELARRADFDK